MSLAIETTQLCRIYKTYEKPEGLINSIKGFWERKYISKTALAPTNLQIHSGQIVGLVGANGAGKTTLLKLLSGLIFPTSGDALVLGYRPWERSNDFLRRISILLGQKNQLWWDIPALDSFALLARIYDLDLNKTKARVNELATILDCTHVLQTQLRRLSLGERMKMEIIGSLLHNPEILFLDEPTIGLDVVAQSAIRKFIAEYVHIYNPTVILTSHYMDDIAKLANRLLLISQGAIVYDGTVANFMAQAETKQDLTVKLSAPLDREIQISPEQTLTVGEQIFTLSISKKDLPIVINKISTAKTIDELKIEEVDFEAVIRSFLEKESRLFTASNHYKP